MSHLPREPTVCQPGENYASSPLHCPCLERSHQWLSHWAAAVFFSVYIYIICMVRPAGKSSLHAGGFDLPRTTQNCHLDLPHSSLQLLDDQRRPCQHVVAHRLNNTCTQTVEVFLEKRQLDRLHENYLGKLPNPPQSKTCHLPRRTQACSAQAVRLEQTMSC